MCLRLSKLIWCLTSVYIVCACNPKASPSKETLANSPSANGTSTQGGGGNLIQGKPLDFYAVDITELPEYRQFIEPIDRGIERALSKGRISYLKTLAKKKSWYMLPVDLDSIPQEKIGVMFASDQGARQTETEVFIAAKEYHKSSKSNEDRAKLLLHELIMAFYRVKFEDVSFYCDSYRDETGRSACLSAIKTNSDNIYLKSQTQIEFLKADQYEPIRSFSNWLWAHFEDMDQSSLINELYTKGFDERFFNPSAVEDSSLDIAPKTIDPKVLLNILRDQAARGETPKNCNFDENFPPKSQSQCDVSFEYKNNAIIFKFSMIGEKPKEFTFDFPIVSAGIQIHPKNFRSNLKLFTVEIDNFAVSDEYDTLTVLLVPTSGADNVEDAYQVFGFSLHHEMKSANGIYYRREAKGFYHAIELISSSTSPLIYSSEFSSL